MKVGILFEFSGRVRDAFIERGHDAVSYDIQDSESDKGSHIKADILSFDKSHFNQYDMIIAFLPCTYFSLAGNRWFKENPGRYEKQKESLELVKWVWSLNVDKMVIENVVGYLGKLWRPCDQIISPHQFGDDYRKRHALWLRNVSPLMFTCINQNALGKGSWTQNAVRQPNDRSRFSKYVAEAMANQWG